MSRRSLPRKSSGTARVSRGRPASYSSPLAGCKPAWTCKAGADAGCAGPDHLHHWTRQHPHVSARDEGGAVEFLTKPARSPTCRRDPRGDELDRRVAPGAPRSRWPCAAYERLDSTRARGHGVLWSRAYLNKQIAGELATTERNDQFHRAHIMQKMEADSVARAVRMAEHPRRRAERDPVQSDSEPACPKVQLESRPRAGTFRP